ncbi:MAG: hypothetical protein R3F07_01685 [Opitutaceae bacterium]
MNRIPLVIAAGSIAACFATALTGGTFTPLGYLSDDPDIESSWASDVSADGKVVVGRSAAGGSIGSVVIEAFRWTEETGMVSLGSLTGNNTHANAVSGDGSVIVGIIVNPVSFEQEAFRWTSETGIVGLGDFDGGNFASTASGVSNDGTVIVGSGSPLNQSIGFRWTSEDGMVSIGDLPGGVTQSNAQAASFDGSIVVGSSYIFQAEIPIRWTSDELVGLELGEGFLGGIAKKTTPDGSVIVGNGTRAQGAQEAFRWSGESGMVGLGSLRDGAGAFSQAYDVTADGQTVVGQTSSLNVDTGYEAFIWDEVNGMRSLKEELEAAHGLNLEGWVLDAATGISDDGSVIVGRGTSPAFKVEAWRVEVTPVTVVVPSTTTLEFSGPLLLKEDAIGTATYSGVAIDATMSGRFTIGATDAGSVTDGPGSFLFGGSKFFGTLLGDGIETSTEGSTDPLEVRFSDDTVPEEDDWALINDVLGASLPTGTAFDLAEIETRISEGNRTIEFGISLISRDLDLLDGSDYRSFPSLDQADAAIYFVVESINGEETFYALGRVSEFFTAPTDVTITDVHYADETVTIDFESKPGVAGWRLTQDTNPGGTFTTDLTLLGTTTIMESTETPGLYRASFALTNLESAVFVRIER